MFETKSVCETFTEKKGGEKKNKTPNQHGPLVSCKRFQGHSKMLKLLPKFGSSSTSGRPVARPGTWARPSSAAPGSGATRARLPWRPWQPRPRRRVRWAKPWAGGHGSYREGVPSEHTGLSIWRILVQSARSPLGFLLLSLLNDHIENLGSVDHGEVVPVRRGLGHELAYLERGPLHRGEASKPMNAEADFFACEERTEKARQLRTHIA